MFSFNKEKYLQSKIIFSLTYQAQPLYNAQVVTGVKMIIFFIILSLVFLVSGGIGLFYINTADHVASGTPLFFLGNLGFATLLAIGILVLVFIALFNTEFE
jgi:hypothetical protein